MLPQKLRELLDEKNLSVTALARESGVPKTNIQGWLDGASPNISQLDEVARYLGVSIEYLAFGRDESDKWEELLEKVHIHTGLYEITVKKVNKK